jgi:hypothetical protein
VYDAHPPTLVIIIATALITPRYLLATYVFSGAPARKGLVLGAITAAFGALLFVVCIEEVPRRLGPAGLIPLFLVPYAIFFHTLSYLSLRRSDQ